MPKQAISKEEKMLFTASILVVALIMVSPKFISTSQSRTVTYKISGSSTANWLTVITFVPVKNGGWPRVTQKVRGSALPWFRTVTLQPGQNAQITVRPQGAYSTTNVTAEIAVDGQVARSAKGAAAILRMKVP
jgi:hypothetical protein